jgi:hypothetical protein
MPYEEAFEPVAVLGCALTMSLASADANGANVGINVINLQKLDPAAQNATLSNRGLALPSFGLASRLTTRALTLPNVRTLKVYVLILSSAFSFDRTRRRVPGSQKSFPTIGAGTRFPMPIQINFEPTFNPFSTSLTG